MKHITDTTTLHNGVKMPWLGLGVWKVEEGNEVETAVRTALEVGYRSIDTAKAYGNEAGVGQAIKDSGVAREDLFVTTKVWNAEQGYESTLSAFEESRRLLDLDVIDLYLIHWPVKGMYIDTWRAMEKVYKEGKVRAIGVSNFHQHHLEHLISESEIVPMVNQVEMHPYLNQEQLRRFCEERNIQLEAWSPLMQGKFTEEPLFAELAEKYGKTQAQIVLRWDLQREIVTIPKSVTPSRIAENADIFDFELSADDMNRIMALNRDQRFGRNPEEFDKA